MGMYKGLVSAAILFSVSTAWAQEQVPPKQEVARELHTTISYSDEAIRTFVETEFAKSNLEVKTAPVIEVLVRDLAKEGAGGFRIGPEDLDYTFEFRRVGADIEIHKVAR